MMVSVPPTSSLANGNKTLSQHTEGNPTSQVSFNDWPNLLYNTAFLCGHFRLIINTLFSPFSSLADTVLIASWFSWPMSSYAPHSLEYSSLLASPTEAFLEPSRRPQLTNIPRCLVGEELQSSPWENSSDFFMFFLQQTWARIWLWVGSKLPSTLWIYKAGLVYPETWVRQSR